MRSEYFLENGALNFLRAAVARTAVDWGERVEIIYTQDSVEGEPGPNVYWRGRPDEFLQLLLNIHLLGISNGAQISLGSLPNIHLRGIRSYKLATSENGHTLIGLSNDEVLTELDPKLWRAFLHNVLSISFSPGFVYQEFPNSEPLIGEANIIMSSHAVSSYDQEG